MRRIQRTMPYVYEVYAKYLYCQNVCCSSGKISTFPSFTSKQFTQTVTKRYISGQEQSDFAVFG